MSDEDFLHACDLPPGADTSLALTTRAVLADLRGVPSETIHPDDPIADHFWDSLDWLDVTMRIEKSANVKIPRTFLDEATLRAGGTRASLQVRHIVQAVLATSRPPRHPFPQTS